MEKYRVCCCKSGVKTGEVEQVAVPNHLFYCQNIDQLSCLSCCMVVQYHCIYYVEFGRIILFDTIFMDGLVSALNELFDFLHELLTTPICFPCTGKQIEF